MADSSTDISGEDHLLLYVRYLNVDTFRHHTEYLCTVRLCQKTAQAIYSVICASLSALDLSLSRMIGFCSDGDAAFTGVINGVGTKLSECNSARTALLWQQDCSHATCA